MVFSHRRFKPASCFGKLFTEKVDKIYKKQMEYNKQVYEESNDRAWRFKKVIHRLRHARIRVLANKL